MRPYQVFKLLFRNNLGVCKLYRRSYLVHHLMSKKMKIKTLICDINDQDLKIQIVFVCKGTWPMYLNLNYE